MAEDAFIYNINKNIKLVGFLRNEKISSLFIGASVCVLVTNGELWQKPHRKLQVAVKSVQATLPS